jgi:hypothetical protein
MFARDRNSRRSPPDLGMYATRTLSSPRGSGLSRAAYLFSWSLIGVAAVAGCLYSLDRNDVLLKEARRRGLETPYLALERRLVGTPGWGTPRSLEDASALPSSGGAIQLASAPVSSPVREQPSSAPAREEKQPSAPSETATSDGIKITSLESLAPVPAAPAARGTVPAVAAAPRSAAVRPARVAESKPSRAASVALASEPEKPAAKPKSVAAPAKAAEPAPKPAPVKAAPAPKPAPHPADDNPLKAAIRSAIEKDGK